jgi:hypothetical protein
MNENDRQYSKMPLNLTEGCTSRLFNTDLKASPEMILMNTWALTREIIWGPKILKKIAGITQYIPPRGIPKSLNGISPLLIL